MNRKINPSCFYRLIFQTIIILAAAAALQGCRITGGGGNYSSKHYKPSWSIDSTAALPLTLSKDVLEQRFQIDIENTRESISDKGALWSMNVNFNLDLDETTRQTDIKVTLLDDDNKTVIALGGRRVMYIPAQIEKKAAIIHSIPFVDESYSVPIPTSRKNQIIFVKCDKKTLVCKKRLYLHAQVMDRTPDIIHLPLLKGILIEAKAFIFGPQYCFTCPLERKKEKPARLDLSVKMNKI